MRVRFPLPGIATTGLTETELVCSVSSAAVLACELFGLQPLRFHNLAGRMIGREMRIPHRGGNGAVAQ